MASFFFNRARTPMKLPTMSPWTNYGSRSNPLYRNPFALPPIGSGIQTSSNSSLFKRPVRRETTASYQVAALSAFGAYDGVWDSITNFAKEVIPSHTVVGKALAGNWSGAAAGAVQYAGSMVGKNPQAVPVSNASPQPQSGGGMMLPSWALPAIMVGAGVLLVTMLRPGGRRR
jgi:hypothetical protein